MTTAEVYRENFSDANETRCLSLFRCSKYEAKFPHKDLRANVTALSNSCQSIKGDHLRDLGISQIQRSMLLSGATV